MFFRLLFSISKISTVDLYGKPDDQVGDTICGDIRSLVLLQIVYCI